jgi:hypothetical protein
MIIARPKCRRCGKLMKFTSVVLRFNGTTKRENGLFALFECRADLEFTQRKIK